MLFATSLASFWTLGLLQSFGIWQRHYGSQMAVDDGVIQQGDMIKRPIISAIGSLGNGGIFAAFGLLYFPHLPSFGQHIRDLCLLGTFFMTLGFGLASISTHLWMMVLTQGILVGVGGGIFLYTLAPILPEYFVKHSGLAQGIALASGSAGGSVLSLSVPVMLDHLGSQATLSLLGSISLAICSAVSFLAQPPRQIKDRNNTMVCWKTFKDPIFTCLFIANFLHALTLLNPITFGPEFSEALGLSNRTGSIILAIMSAVGIPARLITGYVADVVGHQNMLLLAVFTYAVSVWGFWFSAAAVKSEALWIVFSILYGAINGTFNMIVNSAQKRLFGDELYYSYNGAMTSIRGIGFAISPPIVGSLVTRVQNDELDTPAFIKPISYTGTLLVLLVGCVASVRALDASKRGWEWIR
ncbi:unnamed protein product [Periconia digitata]|uniref:Major facilitator superfamily (MFS) profile domain-containing protein n=1 Tax=Periconia digitata TaxID=1303443 RepID=A0A9W4U243_9PLEO|nr:unnamed protein product [Periconia digitata]